MLSDGTLIRKIQQGENSALKLFFDNFYPSACVFARKYLQDKDVAEDIAQEAFIEFWNRKDQFTDLIGVKGFIYTVIRNRCLNHIKINHIHNEILRENLFADENFYELIQEEETYRILHQAINGLAKQSRNIILLSLKGYKNPEIAEELNVSNNTIKTLKKNAYKELKSKLKDHIFILILLNQFL